MPKIENGFVIGRDWNNGRVTMIPVDLVEKIVVDVGNAPPADRVYLRNSRDHIDLLQKESVEP